MGRFIEGTDRAQATLFPECLEDWICEDNPVRAIDVFVEELDLAELEFGGVDPEATGRRGWAATPPALPFSNMGSAPPQDFRRSPFNGFARSRSIEL
jgi:hypothetical protein